METDMQKFILGIVLVGITLILGIYIAATFQTMTRTAAVPNTAVNETLTSVSEIGEILAGASALGGRCSAISICINATDGAVIPSANYTLTGCTVYYSGPAGLFNNTNWKCSYSYTFTNETTTSTASGSLVTALSGGTAWITILVVVGFAVIVLGMLSSGLGKAAGGSNIPGANAEVAYTY